MWFKERIEALTGRLHKSTPLQSEAFFGWRLIKNWILVEDKSRDKKLQ
jgi:hypothetical protein